MGQEVKTKAIYLACAYSHKLESVRYDRFERVSELAAACMQQGYITFSPISHSHPVGEYVAKDKVFEWSFWAKQDLHWLNLCDEMWIMDSPDWKKSEGVMKEIEFALENKKPIKIINPDDYGLTDYEA